MTTMVEKDIANKDAEKPGGVVDPLAWLAMQEKLRIEHAQREAAKRLGELGDTEPTLEAIPRRR